MASCRETAQVHSRPNRNGCVLWVVNLTVGCFGAMLRLLLRHGRLEVRYLRSTPAMSRLTKIFRLFGSRVGFRLVKHLNGAEPDAYGTAIYCRKEGIAAKWSENLSTVLRGIWSKLEPPGWTQSDRSCLYVEREAYDELGELPILLALAEKEVIIRADNKEAYILISNRFNCSMVKRFKTNYHVNPIQEGAIHDLLPNFKMAWRMLSIDLSSDFTKQDSLSPEKLSNAAVQCAEGANSNRRSDLFWWPDSGLEVDRIFYFFLNWTHYHDYTKEHLNRWLKQAVPLDENSSRHLNKQMWMPSEDITYFRRAIKRILLICKLLRSHSLPQLAWGANSAIQFHKLTRYWWYFLEHHSIGCDFSGNETLQSMKAKHVALDIRGGVQFVRQRSMFWVMPLGADFGLYHGHVIFLWGHDGAHIAAAGRNRLVFGIITGFIYDYTFEAARAEALQIRKQLHAHGAKKVIGLFDTNPATPAATPADILRFYNRFLDWVEQDAELGIVAKPKKPLDPHLLPNLEERINEVAQKTGRFLLLSQYKQPALAALGSDFVVGVGFNSAVTEAVIAGVRGAHWDLMQIKSHHYHKWGDDKVVFDDLDKLVDNLQTWLKDKQAMPNLGDFSPIIAELDPFRDGKAHQRVGEYVRWTLDNLAKGFGRNEALQDANNRYGEKWGTDKIIKMNPSQTNC